MSERRKDRSRDVVRVPVTEETITLTARCKVTDETIRLTAPCKVTEETIPLVPDGFRVKVTEGTIGPSGIFKKTGEKTLTARSEKKKSRDSVTAEKRRQR